MAKQKYCLLLITLVLALMHIPTTVQKINPSGININQVFVHSVENVHGKNEGSIEGGTLVKIGCSGHNDQPSQNKVNIGPYPCIIEENGITAKSIKCRTTPAFDPLRRSGLEVEIHPVGKVQSKCDGPCRFDYKDWVTPMIQFVAPSVATPNSDVNFYGIWKVNSFENILKLIIGENNCDRYEENKQGEQPLNLNDQTEMSYSSNTNVNCRIAPISKAGFYNAKIESTIGDPYWLAQSYMLTADGKQKYQFVVQSEITSISSTNGGVSGNELTIVGKGFETNIEKVQVEVAGNACTVTSVEQISDYEQQIKCNLGAAALSTGSGSQYLQGQGVRYTKFDLDTKSKNSNFSDIPETSSFATFLTRLDAGELDGRKQEDRIMSTWESQKSPTDSASRSGMWARGFFKAPRTGTYKFYMSANSWGKVFLNSTPNTETRGDEILNKCGYTYYRQYSYPYECDWRQETGQTLTAGEYYWLEAFAYDRDNSIHFAVSVETPEVPHDDANPIWINALDEIFEYDIDYNHKPQVHLLEISGDEDAKHVLSFEKQLPDRTYFLKNRRTTGRTWKEWASDASRLRQNLDSASSWFSVETVHLKYKAAAGGYCDESDTACKDTATGFEYKFQFQRYRFDNYDNEGKCVNGGNCKFTQLEDQGDPLGGSYQLTWNGLPLKVYLSGKWVADIPYNTQCHTIKRGIIETSIQSQQWDIESYQHNRSQDGFRCRFFMRSKKTVLKGPWPKLVFDDSGLTGGLTPPKIKITDPDVEKGGNKPFHEPVPFDMSFLKSNSPSVTVTVNGIPSVCNDSTNKCGYTTSESNTVDVSSFSLTGFQLTVTLSDASPFTLTPATIKISYGGAECPSVAISGNNLTCTLPAIEAGDHTPKVLFTQYGFGRLTGTSSNTQETVISITDFSAKTSNTNGGIQVTIDGTGFPISNIEGLNVTFGTAQATVVSTTNTQIVVLAPEQSAEGSVDLTVNYNSKSNTSGTQFSYNNASSHTIKSLGNTTASPVKKQQLVVTGENFVDLVYTTKDSFTAWLEKDGKQVYQLNVIAATSTTVTVMLGGGKTGTYQLVIYKGPLGKNINVPATANNFTYEIKLTAVSPQTGSSLGGTDLTLTGTNFLNSVNSNTVFLSNGNTNLQCTTLEVISATSLKIRTPALPEGEVTGPYKVVVQGKLQSESICPTASNCQFTYSSTSLPTLEEVTETHFKKDQKITLTGTNWNGGVVKVLVNGVDYTATTIDATTSEFTVPELLVGQYTFNVRLDGSSTIGSFSGRYIFAASDYSPKRAISANGDIITIDGNGFNEHISVKTGDVECQILERTPYQLKCQTKPGQTGKVHLNVSQLPDTPAQFKNAVNFSAPTSSPKITANTPASDSNRIQVPQTQAWSYQFTLSGVSSSDVVTAYLQGVNSITNKNVGVVSAGSNSEYTVAFTGIQAGSFNLLVHIEGIGFAVPNADTIIQIVEFYLSNVQTTGPVSTGLAGGAQLTLTGVGFNDQDTTQNQVAICGKQCPITSVTSSQIQCTLPIIETDYIKSIKETELPINLFSVQQKQDSLIINGSDINRIGLISGTIVETESACEQEITLSGDLYVVISQVKFAYFSEESYDYKVFLDVWNSVTNSYIQEDVASDSNSDDDFIKTIILSNALNASNKPVKSGLYTKKLRIRQQLSEGAACLTNYGVVGTFYQKVDIKTAQTFTCGVSVTVNGETQQTVNDQSGSAAASITYEQHTSKVDTIVPGYISSLGGDTIKLRGSGFGSNPAAIQVFYDNIQQTVVSATNSLVTVNTVARTSAADNSGLRIVVNGNHSIISSTAALYQGLKYSDDDNTWGGELPPGAGDTIYVGPNQTLIVDQSTAKLYSVIVEGTLVFQDSQDSTGDGTLDLNDEPLNFDAELILIKGGNLIIGTQGNRYQRKLTITLHGNYFGKQLPEFGNKVLGCHTCKLDIHGQHLEHTWTHLTATAAIGATTLQTSHTTNWKVGDLLGIATTDYHGTHSEEATITAISGKTITISKALEYEHLGVTVSYSKDGSNQDYTMTAEVANLSRNILIQGNPEDDRAEQYGGHLKVHGSSENGSQVRLTYVEFRNTGQPRIVGRYTVHFHMIGNAINSLVEGIAVHHAYARVIALHQVHYLKVRKNVGYMVGGHNIFLEDGVETYNTVEYNCIISPRSAFNMLQTDITVAGIWITNPSNFVRFNAVAGSQFYGLWYEIKDRPESGSDKCPIGMEVFEVAHNIGHSNERFGLRFFNLQPRQKPCSPVRDDKSHHPFEDNPSIQYTYRNQTSWKNGESGILAEFMGNSIFEDCFLADNVRTGFQTHTTNFTAEPVIFRNSVVVGYTGQGVDVISVPEMRQSAILVSRTDGQLTSNIDIHNFRANTHILESSSENQSIKLWTQSGYQNIVEKLRLHNSASANKLFWQGPRTNYIYDKDGSLAGSGGAPRWYTPHYDHISAADECVRQSGSDWDDSDVCSRTVRGFKFAAFQDKDLFNGQKLKMLNSLKQDDSKVLTKDEDDITYFGMYLEQKIKNPPKDCKGCYANMYVTGYPYSFHWNYGIDFDHVIFFPNTYFEAGDESTIIKFPYKAQREIFDVKQMSAKKIVGQFQQVISLSTLVNADGSVNPSCQHGQHFNDAENKVFYLCINGNKQDVDKYPIQQLDLTGVYCRDTCPVSGLVCDKETKVRNWKLPTEQDNAAQYLCDDCPGIVLVDDVQTKAIPQDGDDIVIPCKWTVTLNVPVLTVNNLYIDGTLRIPDNDPNQPETKIIAQNIWIRGGQIVAGQENLPFQGKFTIELQGNSNSDALIIDDLSRTGTKSLAITAQLNLYGKFPTTTQTQLTSTANTGDLSIQVAGDIADWKTDDELVLSASHVSGGGFEKVTIGSVSGQTVTLKEPIKNWHYGNPQITIAAADAEKIIGDQYDGVELDMRTQVGHITRNIKIVGNESDIGGHIQIYHYLLEEDQSKGIAKVEARGSAILQGVQMINMGQTGSLNAGLHFTYTNIPQNDDNKHMYRDTVVTKSSIVDCPGYCVNGLQAHDVNFSENIIFNAEKFGLQALEVKNWSIVRNLIIGVKKRPQVGEVDTALWDPVLGIHMYEPYDPNTDTFDVSYNKISGVEGVGIAIPGTPCALKNKIQFKHNTASYCTFDGALFNNLNDECYYNGYFSAFHNTEGATINNNKSSKGYEISHMVFAENQMNLKLHSGSKSVEGNNYKGEKIWMSPYVRTSCTDCYDSTRLGTNSYCSSTNGIRLHVTTEGGEKFPWQKNPFSYDVICVPPNAFGQVFLEQIEFDNYKETYGDGNLCGGNRVFRNHPSGADAQAGHYLRDVTCNDCDQDGKAFLMEPKEKWRGWFGGCGQFDCTGQENVIIQDITGHFIGSASSPTPGTIISNNELIGDQLDECVYVPAWNSYSCSTLDFGILQWDAIGEDKQELAPVPVTVTNDDFSNKVNMWREWEWQGPEPLNQRLNRFVSLISANQWHNITYAGTKSVDIVHKLQTRLELGEPNRYIIVKYMYGNSLALEVLVNGDIVKPYLFENPPNLEDKVSTCGGNNYYHRNNTIHFIVTNAFDCIVQVRQVNQVFVNMRLKMTVEEFYGDVSKQTDFIDRMAAFLEIDFSKIRIVGATPSRRFLQEENAENAKSSEINVEIQITGSVPGRQSQGYQPQVDYQGLTELADKLKKAADGGELTTTEGYQVAGAEYEVIVIKEAGLEGDKADDLFDESDLVGDNKQQQTPTETKNKVSEEEKGKMIAIALGILFGIIGIILIAMIVYHFWKKRQITQVRNQEIPQNEGDDKIHNLNMQQIGQMHASSSHNLSQNNRMIMEDKQDPSQIQQDQVSNNVENIASQQNQDQEQ